MAYGTPRTFKKVGDIKKAWDEFVKPYVKVVRGMKTLKNPKHVPFDYMFASYCGCSYPTMRKYAKNKEAPYGKFNEEMEKIKTEYVALMGTASLLGNNNANFFLSRKLGFVEQQKLKVETDEKSIGLFEKYKRMSDEEFQKEFEKEIKG